VEVALPTAPTAGFQPEMTPASEAKMNSAAPLCLPWCTTKPLVPLKTWPVGAPPGIFTTSGTGVSGLPPMAPV